MNTKQFKLKHIHSFWCMGLFKFINFRNIQKKKKVANNFYDERIRSMEKNITARY